MEKCNAQELALKGLNSKSKRSDNFRGNLSRQLSDSEDQRIYRDEA